MEKLKYCQFCCEPRGLTIMRMLFIRDAGSGSIASMSNAPPPLKSALKPVSQRRKKDEQVRNDSLP